MGKKKIPKKLPKLPNWQKVAKMAKNAKVAKSPQIRLQGVSDGCRSQTAWARMTRGTYARAPYVFAALGCRPCRLVICIYNI